VEVDPEDAPRLMAVDRPELFDLFDDVVVFITQPEFLRRVIERQILDVIRFQRSIEGLAEVFDQGR
jgi:hypothetical protein